MTILRIINQPERGCAMVAVARAHNIIHLDRVRTTPFSAGKVAIFPTKNPLTERLLKYRRHAGERGFDGGNA